MNEYEKNFRQGLLAGENGLMSEDVWIVQDALDALDEKKDALQVYEDLQAQLRRLYYPGNGYSEAAQRAMNERYNRTINPLRCALNAVAAKFHGGQQWELRWENYLKFNGR